jgi:DNA repair protein RecN (Recombination protein N)
MLTQLHIQNIAVIHKATIAFAGGLNVFTGETGAGKTILINAIDAVLGERTSREIIRTGEEKALVSALFEDVSPRACAALEEQGYTVEDGAVLIVREMTAAGKTSCKINGMPATVAMLREIASLMINIHGQRDGQQLLAAEKHRELIDTYGELAPLLEAYGAAYRNMREISAALENLLTDDAQKAQRMDMLTFQIEEIEAAELDDPDEEEALQSRRKAIRNSEKILEGLSTAYAALHGGEEAAGIGDLFGELTDGVSVAARSMDSLEPLSRRLEEIGYELTEAGAELRGILDEFEFNQQELDDIEDRLDVIYKLRRKYGESIAVILSFLEDARRELEAITTSEERARLLTAELEKARAEAENLADKLTEARKKAAASFIREVEAELVYLDMPAVKLSLSHRARELSPHGADELAFLVITNVGEQPKPLSRIASGGEVARMMLAIKNVLADKDDIDTLIFDEIDTGVSGRAAGKIGAKLRQVSQKRQVICVTHLAQVAACADQHLYIYKEVEGDRTYTRVEQLRGEVVYHELARITGGDLITETALENARQLWEYAHG